MYVGIDTLAVFSSINPLTASAAYIGVFIFYEHIKYHILNMLMIKPARFEMN